MLTRRPAADAVGGFGEDLPYIVLSRRTLPWERRGFGSASPPNTPWLALVVLRQDECDVRENVAIADVVGAAPAPRFPAGQGPRGHRQAAAHAQQLLPRVAEVPLLCHAREVNLADTALAMARRRLVRDRDRQPDPDRQRRARHAVRRAASSRSRSATTCSARGDAVADRAGRLELHQHPHGRHVPAPDPGDEPERVRGRRAHSDPPTSCSAPDREGAPGTAAYRGPLSGHLPSAPAPEADRSLDVARELGRLLAAADGRFLREMIAWRRGDALSAAQQASAHAVSAAFTGSTAKRAVAGRRPCPRSPLWRRSRARSAAAPGAPIAGASPRSRASRPSGSRRNGGRRRPRPPPDPLAELRRERDRIAEEAS